MRIWHWVIATFLLLTLTADAQQSANMSSPTPMGRTPVSAALPTEMDQAVDRLIKREHSLMELLNTRTPIVETYLQDLKFDPRVGPVPVQDHYFLGRMDLGDTVDRREYLLRVSLAPL